MPAKQSITTGVENPWYLKVAPDVTSRRDLQQVR